MFCTACREEIALKKSVISMHIKSKKHERGKNRAEKQNRQELSFIDALKHFDKEHHPVGKTLTCHYACVPSKGDNFNVEGRCAAYYD